MRQVCTFIFALLFSTASLNSFSLPLSPLDSRSIGMGGTGVASARTAQAARFNPALLSLAKSDEDFSLIFPQLGAMAADEEELFESVTDFVDSDYVSLFETSVDNIRANVATITANAPAINAAVNTVDVPALQAAVNSLSTNVNALNFETLTVDQNTNALIASMQTLDNKAVRGKLGGNIALAFPSQDFGMAFSMNSELNFSGILVVTQNDTDLLDIYSDAAVAYSGELVDYSNAASNLLNATIALDTAITNGNVGAIPALQTAVDNAQTAFNTADNNVATFNYGGSATPGDSTDGDKIIFTNGDLANDADDVDLTSNGHFVAVTTTEFGWSISKSFNFNEQAFSIGITPKLQEFGLYDYVYLVESDEDIEFDDVLDTEVSESAFNLDVGVVQSFGEEGQWRIGLTAKNLLKQEFRTALGAPIEISPQVRTGVAYTTGWITLAADYDLTKNDAVAFGTTTQYFMLGAEIDVFDIVQLRSGYRSDTANSGFESYSLGIGFSPFGVRFDLSGFVNTTDIDNEAGAAFEIGIEW